MDNMEESVIRIIVICPSCGRKSIVGGETDYDPEYGECVQVFGEDYNHNQHSNLPKVSGIRDFRGVAVSDANWAIEGHHKGLGAGILSWHVKEWEAKVHAKNLRASDPNAKTEVVTKNEALTTK
jgi:hypothetical protein